MDTLDFESYAPFFSQLSVKSVDCITQQLTLGSDDELVIKKCFGHFFSRASVVTCSLHLKKNASAKLEELLGSSSPIRIQLFDSLFKAGSLIECNDVISFDACVEAFRDRLLVDVPSTFVHYFENRVLPLMHQNVVVGPQFPKWTNNNCESINHTLKEGTSWMVQQLPTLIDIRVLIVVQYNDAAEPSVVLVTLRFD